MGQSVGALFIKFMLYELDILVNMLVMLNDSEESMLRRVECFHLLVNSTELSYIMSGLKIVNISENVIKKHF